MAMSSSIIQAANLLYKTKEEFGEVSKDLGSKLNPDIDKLRDALLLAGKTNPQINTYRRESFKPSIPAELKRIPPCGYLGITSRRGWRKYVGIIPYNRSS